MSPLILGTAGLIDHGMTTLVRVLAGIDTELKGITDRMLTMIKGLLK